MTISIIYTVEELDAYDRRGRKQVRITESYEGVDAEPKTFVMPGFVTESFIRARRDIAKRVLESQGYTKSEPIDWSFLEKGTKQ